MNIYAIDLGGTNIRAGVVTTSGRVLELLKYSVLNRDKTTDGIILKLTEIIRRLMEKEDDKIKGTGIAVPGFIDFKKNIIIASPNYPHWKNFSLVKKLQKVIKSNVFLENDANAFAIGEGWKGAGRGFNSFVGITLGTGVGGGIILDTKIWHGGKGAAGEIGHLTVEPEGLRCNCGNRGCLEMYASAQAVARKGRNLLRKKGIRVSNNDMSFEIFQLAQKGNREAIKIFGSVGYYLGIAIADITNLLNIDGVIIGGGMSNAWKFIYPAIKKEISYRINPLARRNLRIVRSKLKDYAALMGVAKLISIK